MPGLSSPWPSSAPASGYIPLLPIGSSAPTKPNPPKDGTGTYSYYAGPVFLLTLREPEPAITAERNVTLDFAPGAEREHESEILTSDSAALTNISDTDRTVTVLYPFASDLSMLETLRPELTLDGASLDYALRTWTYVGGFEGAGGDKSKGSMNLDPPGSWEDYRDALADGGYLSAALAGEYPDLSGIPATVYELSDATQEGGQLRRELQP